VKRKKKTTYKQDNNHHCIKKPPEITHLRKGKAKALTLRLSSLSEGGGKGGGLSSSKKNVPENS